MTVGYLHLGPPEHGVHRYGRLLAAAARAHGAVQVIERTAAMTQRTADDIRTLREVAAALREADVIHLQLFRKGSALWGSWQREVAYLSLFRLLVGKPIVATLHDNYASTHRGLKRRIGAPFLDALLLASTRRLIVSFEHERQALGRRVRPFATLIPHFVEPRAPAGPRDAIKRRLGLDGTRVVTVLGFIHQRKGHDRVLAALRYLPDDVRVVFAGAPSTTSPEFFHALLASAPEARDPRLRITGYLDEAELDAYLAATDLALAPYRGMSASGSVATWISAGVPILATDLDAVRELNQLEPGAIAVLPSSEPVELAGAISAALDRATRPSAALARLKERLSLDEAVRLHLERYREAARVEPV